MTHPNDRGLVIEALSRLSSEQRAVILQSFYMRWTTTQIAADLNITDGTVKSTLRDALREFAQHVSRCERAWGVPE